MQHRFTLCALAACLHSAFAQFGGSPVTYSGKASTLSEAYAMAELQAELGGRPLSCALINSLQSSIPPLTLGIDGFAFLLAPDSPAVLDLLANASPTGAYITSIARKDFDGALPWMMDWLSQTGNISVRYSLVRLPASVSASSDSALKVRARTFAFLYTQRLITTT